MENRKLIKNKSSNEDFFVSVVPVKKEISIPMKLDELQLPDTEFSNIIFEAAIYKNNEIKSPTPKPFLIVNLDDGLSKPETQEVFEQNIFNLVENSNLNNNDSVMNELRVMGYESLIHNIWNLFFLSNIKHVFIFRR